MAKYTPYPPYTPNDLTLPYSSLRGLDRSSIFKRREEQIPDLGLSTENSREDVTGSRTYVVGSIEGSFDPLIRVMSQIINGPLAKNDSIVFLGDYIGGTDTRRVMTYLNKVRLSKINATFLKGDMDHRFCKGRYQYLSSDEGTAALLSYTRMIKEARDPLIDTGGLDEDRGFISKCKEYKELDKVFMCHGGLSQRKTSIDEQSKGSIVFMKSSFKSNHNHYGGKLIITSGTPTLDGKAKISQAGRRLNLNVNPSKTGRIAAACIDNKTGKVIDILYG